MIELKCLDCNEIIGGVRYQFWFDNQVVGEMDGVIYLVWLEQVNMENYDF